MMNENVCADLQRQIGEAAAEGKCRFVLWGFNENCIRLLAELRHLGLLESCVSGVVDGAPEKRGVTVHGFPVLAPAEVAGLDLDVLVVTSDEGKEASLREFHAHDERIPQIILSGTQHFEFRDPVFEELLGSCLVRSYANGYPNTLIHIYQSIRYLASSGIRGDVAEFGIFKGGTVVFIAKVLEHFGFGGTRIWGFDIFEGFPTARSPFDLYSNPKCEFRDHGDVEAYCRRHGIEVVKGDICDTHRVLADRSLMLSFFDTDNYSPARAALETCYARTVRGGVFAFDHYTSEERFLYTIGERMAAQDVLGRKNAFHLHGTGIFVKCEEQASKSA